MALIGAACILCYPLGLEVLFESDWAEQAPQTAWDDSAGAGHTCSWLYKNAVVDAHGRILACCGHPGPRAELVLGHYDKDGGDLFNTERHLAARQVFRGGLDGESPHCQICRWAQGPDDVNISASHAAANISWSLPGGLDEAALESLSTW